MPMNVQPIAGVSDRINEIRLLTAEIVNKEILPNENELWVARRDDAPEATKRRAKELRDGIKDKVKQAGLWAPHLPEEYGGCGLSFLEHAYMNEVLAYTHGRGLAVRRRRAQLRQPEDPREVRHARAEAEVADPAHRGEDGVGLLDDRARLGRLRSALDQDHRAPRGRRVGDQRPQVVHVERQARRLLHRDVPHGRADGAGGAQRPA